MITVETVGQKLQRARGKRKLSLEDASRATKIRSRQLADLERDEYSNFPNLAYAKGFLISYGKYLEVDVRPYLDAFGDASSFGLDNYQYLSETPLGVYRATRRPARRRRGRARYTVAAGALGALVLTVLGWQLYVSYQRLGDLDKLAEHQEALEHAAQGTAAPKADAATATSSAVAPAGNDLHSRPAGTGDAVESAPAPDFFHSTRIDDPAPGPSGRVLPLPNDGGAVRQLLAVTDEAPFLISGAAAPPSPATGPRIGERGFWLPDNLDGYRFYVRTLNHHSVEIFRLGTPRPRTVLNNPF
jgi:transcriptional regulator with XRE-family HTH domain